MTIATTDTLEESARRLFPNQSLEQVIAGLLLERAQRNLIKYQVAARQFEVKYGQSFEGFRQRVLTSEPDFQEEQDYFDWELAVTGAVDMQAEIQRLRSLGGER